MKKLASPLHLGFYPRSIFSLKMEARKNAKLQRPFKSTILQLSHQFFRLLTQRARPKLDDESTLDEEEPPVSFSNLPTEILLLIFDQLPLPTQVCLALTCKILYEDLGYILQDERLFLSAAWANKTAEPPLSQSTLLRNQFLFTVEDDRWLYCSGCLRLHPRHLFSCYGQSRPSARRRCQHGGGVVDVCACLVMTYSEKQQLEQWLRTGRADSSVPKRIRLAFTPLTRVDGEVTLLHRCSITDHSQAFVDIAVTALIGGSSSLELHSSHHLHLYFTRAAIDGFRRSYNYNITTKKLEPIFLCPHLEILNIIFGWRSLEPKVCAVCDTIAEIPDWIGDEMNVIVKGVRSLGGVKKFTPYKWDLMCRNEFHKGLRRWYNNPGD